MNGKLLEEVTAKRVLWFIMQNDLKCSNQYINALREAILIRDGMFALSNANHLSVNELNYLIEWFAIDLK